MLPEYYVICMKEAGQGDCVQLLQRETKINEHRARKIFLQLIHTLQFIHSSGYSHRDVKPDNILLCQDDFIILTDFEFCLRSDPTIPFTQYIGTFKFSSPELRRENYFGHEADLWAAGVTLYCLLHGKFPFTTLELQTGTTTNELFESRIDPSLSKSCKDLLCRMLSVYYDLRLRTTSGILDHPWCTASPQSIAVTSKIELAKLSRNGSSSLLNKKVLSLVGSNIKSNASK